MKLLCVLTVLVFVSQVQAQSTAPQPATGSIMGHVYLGDTHLPARMATVALLPAAAADAGKEKPAASTGFVQVGLDGSFFIPNVLPGSYYVIAKKVGYIMAAPVSYEDFANYEQAPKDVKEALAAAFPPIAVAANRITTSEIVLNKGAVISGAVRFDDGEPDSGAALSLLRRGKSGKWIQFGAPDDDSETGTDDQGNFRFAGLPAGEYLLRTSLALQGALVNNSGNGDVSGDPGYRWDIYFGDGIRPRDAKTITLKDGEEASGDNITIPLSRLHAVSGTVVSLETGMPLGSAHVEIHNLDDDSLDSETAIGPVAGQFHLPYVAEGEYTLKVTHAADLAPGSQESGDEKPIRTYADASRALIVKGETGAITIQLKPQPMAATPAAAQ